jgi:hypothetical protein
MKSKVILCSLALLLVTGCLQNTRQPTVDAAEEERTRRYDAQLDAGDRQIKRADEFYGKSEDQARRFDQLLGKWEEQARRQDAVLDAMEKQFGIKK